MRGLYSRKVTRDQPRLPNVYANFLGRAVTITLAYL